MKTKNTHITQIFAFFILLFISQEIVYAQGVGIGTTTPNASAKLDVTSTTQGFLPPRMTQAQRDAIASPVAGLMIYQTDNVEGMRVYNSTAGKWLLQTPLVATIKDVRASGINGGSSVANTWLTRDLNTLDDPFGVVTSLSSNQFTLSAGRYLIEATAPAFATERSRSSLYNLTNNSYVHGGSTFCQNTLATAVVLSNITAHVIVVSGTNIFEIRTNSTVSNPSNAFGVVALVGGIEVYTQVKITKIE